MKVPCLPDVIHHRKSLKYIDERDLSYLYVKISDINKGYCGDGIQNVTSGAVRLERKN